MTVATAGAIGSVVADLEISRAWLVDPASGREGPGEIVVTDGILEAVTWLDGSEADGIDDRGIVVAPGFIDLHAHLREPGNEDAETVKKTTWVRFSAELKLSRAGDFRLRITLNDLKTKKTVTFEAPMHVAAP